ncbi:ubiquitination pathway protein [Suhomyces tanzawaensis NRRL Y-17324]|uniref:Ubiquitination pathway protein n=1 Tax=Suhomyces tanzawaensis NRRL Y-17324 TaxID=984487 RepID=A0A1E4SMP7_9ASCO|nr:ubiquitination pathway protein [Suhomyces tanzawaensis NRRL Y-17324]ODV80790.1 ubiquitination pathway protein [Suhomyces tanzawaensis NRRL Y-17324]
MSRNKFNLKLSSLSIRRNQQPEDDEELLLNILPSYQMYQSTVSKHLTPTSEDMRTDPPGYELTPQTSNASNASNNSVEYLRSLPTSPVNNPQEFLDAASGSVAQFDDTILENVHKLKRLTSINKELSKSLNIQIYLTEKIGKIGEKPKIIDPLGVELRQGDYIFGYILVTNKTKQDIPFDMFSVVLEGLITYGNMKNSIVQPPSHIVRFLNMFDFNASWNDACLDRLPSDHNNPYIPINEIDPVDGTHVNFNYKKILEPNITYKKFFTFRMPEKLLDSTCEHGLVKHLQIPSSLGISKNEIITALRRKWKENDESNEESARERVKNVTYASITNDFAFQDCSIDFSISARIIGKASDYEHLVQRNALPHLNPTGDEYVVANEDYCYLRVINVTNSIFESNRSMINEEAKLIYDNMINKINEKIVLGKELMSREQKASLNTSIANLQHSESSTNLQPTSSAAELAKMQQSYYKKVNPTHQRVHRDNVYEVFMPYKKKSVFGTSKIIGLIACSTPKTEYRVNYNPLDRFKKPNDPIPPTEVKIPIDLTFVFSDNHSTILPDLKRISVELVCLTIKSKSLPIPVVFHPDMLFENKSKGTDNFDLVTIRKFQKYAIELSKIIKEVGFEALEMDKELIQDVKCLANLSSKYDHLKITNTKIEPLDSSDSHNFLSSIPWESETLTSSTSTGQVEEQIKYFKKFNLKVDIKNAVPSLSTAPEFCLVPDFQSCLLSRLYYLKVNLKCPNGDKIAFRVPLVLQKPNSTRGMGVKIEI